MQKFCPANLVSRNFNQCLLRDVPVEQRGFCRNHRPDRVHDLYEDPRAVLPATTVFICTEVAIWARERVEQESMRAVDLDHVKASLDCPLRRVCERLNNALDPLLTQLLGKRGRL